ncbi:YdcF family protein [Actinoplanes palleronii]|uniref:YdcF family protein n=1 Tax=Actinoplanes palleronii TaxID=113570 RepID=UPI0019427C7C|nr:YdcF family protein [Actinoplanes palleronii]
MGFEVLPGTPGLILDQVAHILVPGRGRAADGLGLTPLGAARVTVAAELHRSGLGGVIVCSGYKSPIDGKGAPWTAPDAPGETFQGMPEADAMRDSLLASGFNPDVVRVERRSVDTVTNLLRCENEGHFGDDRPVAIVSQRAHLRRILTVIAPRALRRPYLGVVAPEPLPLPESRLAALISRMIVTGLPRDPARAIASAHRRSELLWSSARLLGKRTYH